MDPKQLRQIIKLLEEFDVGDDQLSFVEADHTDEIDFSPTDSFDEVMDKVKKDERNRIGIGKYRQTWHHPFDKRLVVKFATPRETTQTLEDCQLRNMWEFLVWHHTKGRPEHEELMPCKDIHPEGLWLTMRKGQRVQRDEINSIRKKTTWIMDRKKENFAQINDKIYMVDYGKDHAMEHLGMSLDFDFAVKAVAKILTKHGVNHRSPNYGKSRPHPDPFADKD
jgi:hypothetical protein